MSTDNERRVEKTAASELAAAGDGYHQRRIALKRELAGHVANQDDANIARVTAELAAQDGVETAVAAAPETASKRKPRKV